MFDNVRTALYRFHILSSTMNRDHPENCNIISRAYKELDAAEKAITEKKEKP